MKKKIRVPKVLRGIEYWKYILAKDKYTFKFQEGHFNVKHQLLFYGDTFDIPLDEGREVVVSTLDMIKKDITIDTRILDLTKKSKLAVLDYNKQENKYKNV